MKNIKEIIDVLKASYSFRLNSANHKTEFHLSGEDEFRELTDIDLNSIRVDLALKGLSCSRDNLRTIIFSDVWDVYDPFKEFLDALPLWDGTDHIAKLAATVKTDSDSFWAWCLKKWLVAFVGSLAVENVVNQTAIILCGGQGLGKSTWLSNILPPVLRKYSSAGFLDPKDKETLVQLSELCIFNLDEVENLKPKNVEAVKEIITKSSMYLRRAYTTLSSNYTRRCSFCGTANGTNILHDITGNRRFLCQNVLSIDYQLHDINLEQVYAQAIQLFRTGFQYWFSKDEQSVVETNNARFRAMSLEEELISSYYVATKDESRYTRRLSAHEILVELQSKGFYGRLNNVVIGKVLSAQGFRQIKSNGISKWLVRDRSQE